MPPPPTGVAVLGCGWLGLPLARNLVKAGYRVSGSTTTPEKLDHLRYLGVEAYLLQLGSDFDPWEDRSVLDDLLRGQTTLVLNVPPRAGLRERYAELLQPVAEALPRSSVRHIVFVSSTGVYPDAPRLMHEPDALAAPTAASPLLRAEALFAAGPWACTVLRLGGLFGPDRPPGRFLAGRVDLPQPAAPVNLLHLTDAVGVIQAVLAAPQAWGRTFNVCAATHPSREAFYTAAAGQLNLPPPRFRADDASSGKSISSAALREHVGYAFRHDDLLAAVGASTDLSQV